MKRIIIDTDPGIDDAFALLYAVACGQFDLAGVTTVFGNASVQTTTRNALWLLEQLGQPGIPVARGSAAPLSGRVHVPPVHIHGQEGFGPFPPRTPRGQPLAENAADFMARTAATDRGNVTIIALGPLTNVAEALTRHPGFAADVGEIIVMGGAFETAGNKRAYVEDNISNVAQAACIVAESHARTSFVGLDITNRILLSSTDIQSIAHSVHPDLSDFIQKIGAYYIDFYASKGMMDGAGLHDPATIIAAHDPGLFDWHQGRIDVSTSGAQSGRTRLVSGSGSCRAALDADLDGIKSQFMSVLINSATAATEHAPSKAGASR